MSKQIFITGTGTDVGKTYVAALLVKKLAQSGRDAAYYKAAMSGNERNENGELLPGDALFVKRVSGISQDVRSMCPYVYEHAYSPHLAARLEGNHPRMAVIREGFEKVAREHTFVTVEGSGGILCPIGYDEERIQLEDVVRELKLSSLLVADAGLGTINHVGLTAAYMQSRGLPIVGIILNRFHPGNVLEEDNRRMCERMTGLPVVACVKPQDEEIDIDEDVLAQLYQP